MSDYTKDRQEYEVLKAKTLDKQLPFKQVKLEDIRYVERIPNRQNIITVEGQEFIAPDRVIESLDRMTGLSGRQKKVVYNAGGDDGLRDIRNYFTSAKALKSAKGFIVYANPKTQRVERILPVLGSVISLEAFFSLAEMFMSKYHLQPEAFEFSSYVGGNITLRMGYHSPDIKTIRKGEEFELSGYYMRWTGNQIELGLYAVRVVCSNGQTISLGRSSSYRITSLDPREIDGLMGIPSKREFIDYSFGLFQNEAERAMATPASMWELRAVNWMLRDFMIPDEEREKIAPFYTDIEAYKQKGFGLPSLELKNTVSSVNSWDLYNRLTAFATHTDFWKPDDLSRDILRQNAAAFLRKPRDIKSYANIFK